ncbi:uncharacterized protein LOC133104233 [Eubalaena glacialis]|uniref:uncharacterized protein LOC133104233 n=1 Tax=Eubalaena glacialis TaxID=27606 RepID=UPI002A5AD90F|nr:uncharacterized protein LOC133104233 [Eubalaena glacialis]
MAAKRPPGLGLASERGTGAGMESPGRDVAPRADTRSTTSSFLVARGAPANPGPGTLAAPLLPAPNSQLQRRQSHEDSSNPAGARSPKDPGKAGEYRETGFRQVYIRGTRPPPPGRELRKAPGKAGSGFTRVRRLTEGAGGSGKSHNRRGGSGTCAQYRGRKSLVPSSQGFLPDWTTVKPHHRSVLSFFRGYRTQAPDREGILLKKGARNSSCQHRWFILRGNLLFYLEHQADPHTPEPHPVRELPGGATPWGHRTLRLYHPDPRGRRGTGLQAGSRKPGEAGSLAVLLRPLEAQHQELCQAAGQETSSPPEDWGSPQYREGSTLSSLQELHEHFGKEIRVLQAAGAQTAPGGQCNGGSGSQAEVERELNHCLLMND